MLNQVVTVCLVVVTVLVVLSLAKHNHPTTCNEVQCCPGTVCTEKPNKAKCSKPDSCSEIKCPDGFRCMEKNKSQTKRRKSKVYCHVSCSDVQCPDFTECKEKGKGRKSYAVCKIPKHCSTMNCTSGLQCLGHQHPHTPRHHPHTSLCLTDSCKGIDCGMGGECREGTIKYKKHFRSKTLRRFLDTIKDPMKPPKKSPSDRGYPQHSSHHNHSRYDTAATCVPTCQDNTCPQGLVCEQKKLEVRCRAPRSCEELDCPAGKSCKVTACKKHNILSDVVLRGEKTKKKGKLYYECVDDNQVEITASQTQTSTLTATTTTQSQSMTDQGSMSTTTNVNTASETSSDPTSTSTQLASSTANTMQPSPSTSSTVITSSSSSVQSTGTTMITSSLSTSSSPSPSMEEIN